MAALKLVATPFALILPMSAMQQNAVGQERHICRIEKAQKTKNRIDVYFFHRDAISWLRAPEPRRKLLSTQTHLHRLRVTAPRKSCLCYMPNWATNSSPRIPQKTAAKWRSFLTAASSEWKRTLLSEELRRAILLPPAEPREGAA